MTEEYQMIRYIRESPAVLERTLEGNEPQLQSISQEVRNRRIDQVVICGLGSSYTAAMMAGPIFSTHCPYKTMIVPASELHYYAPTILNERTLLIAVSRSGERGAVVDALIQIVQAGGMGVAVTGVEDNLLAKNAEFTLLTHEGEEKAFPKTKSVLASAGILMALGCALAGEEDHKAKDRMEALCRLPASVEQTIIGIEPEVQSLLPFVREHTFVGVAGTASNHGVALEAAIKIQEAAYILTRGDSIAGWIHGPVGALHDRCLLIPLVMESDEALNKQLLTLAGRFGAHSLCLQAPGIDVEAYCDHALTISGDVDPFLAALLYLPPIQLIAYYWAVDQSLDPDVPELTQPILDVILPPGREEPDL